MSVVPMSLRNRGSILAVMTPTRRSQRLNERLAGAGNFLSPAFSSRQASATRATLSQIADIAIYEFRLAEELPRSDDGRFSAQAWQVPGVGQAVVPRGDEVLAAESLEVLQVVDRFLFIGKADDQLRGKTQTAALYGFEEQSFKGGKRKYTAARLLISITADAWFDPYATGFWNVTRERRIDLRIDLRSATEMIWAWAVHEHPALAYALSVARRHPVTDAPLAFEPFTRIYQCILSLHLDDTAVVEAAATSLSELTVARLRHVAPGRSAYRNLFAPAIGELLERYGVDLRPPKDESDSSERLAESVVGIYRELRTGERGPDEAIEILNALTEGIRLLGVGES